MTSTQTAWSHWATHNGRARVSTELAVQQFLHEVHPTYHITRTTPVKCDLLGFAEAGHATKAPDRGDGHDATRFYKAPKRRDEQEQATLDDDVKFGAWRYTWGGVDYRVYESSYPNFFDRPHCNLYVLAPDAGQARDGYHPATDRLLLAAGEWTKTLHDEIYVFDDSQWKKDKDLYKSVQGASWDDVILEAGAKAALMHDVETFFDNRELYRAMNVPWKRGIIFHGVPGNGKTISIRALINSLAAREPPVPALYVKSLDSCNGPKWAMQTIFARARVLAPCLLIFEDLDSLVEEKSRSYFLNEVDGLESNDGVMMIGTTNHLAELDPAIAKRPSRFDRKYHFKVPDEKSRVAYCQFWKEKFSDSSTVDFPDEICPVVAKMTDGFSFAYLKELFITTLLGLARGPQLGAMQDAPKSESGSDSDQVIVETPPSVEETEAEKPKAMLKVEIPESLRDNMLLNVLKPEAESLREQMSNFEGEALAKKKAAAACPPIPFPLFPKAKSEED
jgi:hypothetical protein